jgi:hypothetical protein
MNIKEINKIPEKHNEGYEALDTTRGVEAAWEGGYDNLIKVQEHIKTLRKIITMMTFVTAISLGGFVYKTAKNPYIPYIVRISETGSINGQVVTQSAVTVDEKTMQYFLTDFIKKTRTFYSQAGLYQRESAPKLSYLTGTSKSKLQELFKTKMDTENIVNNGYSSTVVFNSFLQDEPGKKYRIVFTENIYNTNGSLLKQTKYTALFTVGRTEVTNDEMVRMNPLGIVITDVDISVETSTGTLTVPQQSQSTAQQSVQQTQPVQSTQPQSTTQQSVQQTQPMQQSFNTNTQALQQAQQQQIQHAQQPNQTMQQGTR